MKKVMFSLLASLYVINLTFAFIMHGIPFMHASDDNWGVEYSEPIEWHEIGGLDPRYTDPCGPGIHAGDLGEPGCHGLPCPSKKFPAFQLEDNGFPISEEHQWFASGDDTLHYLFCERAPTHGFGFDEIDEICFGHYAKIWNHWDV